MATVGNATQIKIGSICVASPNVAKGSEVTIMGSF
jgi:hypothetical protein